MHELQFHSMTPSYDDRDFAGANGVAGFGLVAFGALRFPLVVELLALGERYLAFYPAIFQIHAGGDQREPLFPGGGQQFIDLAAVQQTACGRARAGGWRGCRGCIRLIWALCSQASSLSIMA